MTDGFERTVEAALDEEERLLARIAEAAGAGLDATRIARYLGVSVGLVCDVLHRPQGVLP